MKLIIKQTQRTAYCCCSEQITIKGVNPSRAIALWRKSAHQGPGCGPCSRRVAALARAARAVKPA